ncbi:hypothetical protein CCO03_15275 [Comamonas serinivorans]|uniref:Cardiolipin synthase N-terminal domain-containing protein n=1 Tax=Comamonas serinivorans TaxID=1082851 RepID=A0A1Y0EQK3_9BURK|nr:hypothetical protein [Comamonas serinivorans]ARU05856.1 hypothetical protein CCO03_15275 [Comamonas serinivorans]
MAFFGIGIHVVVALFFAVHAVRTGQAMYWLFILFAFPGLGSVAYFVAVFLPSSRLQRHAGKAVKSAVKVLDPTRELREAAEAHRYAPTAQNQMRLAAAQLEAGQTDEAVRSYEACLNGPFASDLEMRFNAARANLAAGHAAQTLSHLDFMAAQNADFRPQETQLLRARALAAGGDQAAARAQFEAVRSRFGGFDATAEYAIWALTHGETALAQSLQDELDQVMARWHRGMREVHGDTLRRLAQAKKQAQG